MHSINSYSINALINPLLFFIATNGEIMPNPKPPTKQIRIAVIEYDRCQPQKCNYLCERICPVNRTGKECIVTDLETGKPAISEELCTACGICTHKCPFGAIHIVNLSAKLGKPVHQYGRNGFRLYRLPYPHESQITGIIGRNGIGKTTVLRILSGRLIPNLGDCQKAETLEAAIEFFRGKELQNFFEKLRTSGIKVSYKPQNIEEIPKSYKGKAIDLLKKTDERKKLAEVSEQLGLEQFLEQDISELSGGELQRVAIAACMLRNADLYAVDEPSSFLDVSERLRMAKALRALTLEGKGIIVIEHDLAVLDYLSDYVHILFGERAAYGIVSSQKSVRNGINEFLDGYIADENLRFRSNELRFEPKPPAEPMKGKAALEYPALEKSYPSFHLSTAAGTLYEGEVLGILGPNAIGKTTFVKMLAGIEKPDNAAPNLKAKVSYKPQYLAPEPGITVGEALSSPGIDKALFKNEIDRRLQVSALEDCMLSSLSGGELQKVAVSIALARECNIFLLDEPSAFVDVEDRLNLADAVRAATGKTSRVAMVVDHDILFQDYVSDRLLVFAGKPSLHGFAAKPVSMHQGMNSFLRDLGITYRRDPQTGRPRANKPDSVKDREQKEKGEYYYILP